MSNSISYILCSNLRNLIFLSRFTSFLCVSPRYEKSRRRFARFRSQRIYNAIIICVLLILYAVSLPGRSSLYKTEWLAWKILDIFSLLSRSFISFFAIIINNILNGRRCLNIFNYLLQADEELELFGVTCISKKPVVYFQLLSIHILVTVIIAFHSYIWYNDPLGEEDYQYYLLENLQRYHPFFAIILIYHIALTMKYQFENLNRILRYYAEESFVTTLPGKNEVNKLQGVYVVLLCQIKNFNDSFGLVIFIVLMNVMIGFLKFFNALLFSEMIYNKGSTFLSIMVMWMSYMLWMISVIAMTCGSTTKAARETGPLCYALCTKVRRSRNIVLREELLTFARLASISNPTISAAGFFNVDHAMLSHAFTILISYVIVILQLYG